MRSGVLNELWLRERPSLESPKFEDGHMQSERSEKRSAATPRPRGKKKKAVSGGKFALLQSEYAAGPRSNRQGHIYSPRMHAKVKEKKEKRRNKI